MRINTLIIALFVIFGIDKGFGQTDKFWAGGNGDWSDPSKWIPVGVPTQLDTVALFSSSVVNINIDINASCVSLELSNNVYLNINDTLIIRPHANSTFGIGNAGVIYGNSHIDITYMGSGNTMGYGIHNRLGGIFTMNPGMGRNIYLMNLGSGILNEHIFTIYGGIIFNMTFHGIENRIPNSVDSLVIKHDALTYNPLIMADIGGHALLNNSGKMRIEANVDLANAFDMPYCILIAENNDLSSSIIAETTIRGPFGGINFPFAGPPNTTFGVCANRKGLIRNFGNLLFYGHTISTTSSGLFINDAGGVVTGF